MSRKIKRGLALLLALMLALGALPAASAASDDIRVNGTWIYGNTTLYVSAGSSSYYDLSEISLTVGSDYDYSFHYGSSVSSSSKITYQGSEYYNYNLSYYNNVVYIKFTNVWYPSNYYVVTIVFETTADLDNDDFYIVCEANSNYYFYRSDFTDPGYYGYYLDDYYDDEVYVLIQSLPSYGTLYYRNSAVSNGDKIYLSNIENLRYSKGNYSRTDSFKITLYDSYSGKNLAKGATMYVLEEDTVSSTAGVASSFTVSYDSGDYEVLLTSRDFTDNYTEGSGGALAYVQIESLPSSREGSLYLSDSAVRTGDKISSSKLRNLTFELGSSFEDGVYFTYSVIDNRGNTSNVARVVFSNENYKPVLTDITAATKKNTSITLSSSYFSKGFYDLNGDSLSKVQIVSLPESGAGTLYLNNSAVSSGAQISSSDLRNLKFTPESDYTGTATFRWNATDGTSYAENDTTFNIIVAASISNTAGSFSIGLDQNDEAFFTANMFSGAFVSSSSKELHSIKITELPTEGTLYLNERRISRSATITYSELSSLVYEADSGFSGKDYFEYTASDSGSSFTRDSGVVTIGEYTGTSSKYTLSVDNLNKTLTLTFDAAAPDGNSALFGTLDAGAVSSIINQVGFTGGTLYVKIPSSTDGVVLLRSLTIDKSLFTSGNSNIFSEIALSDNVSNTVTLSVKTASVAALYSTSADGSFTITLARQDLSDTADEMNAGIARSVVFSLGGSSVVLPGNTSATISIPYAAATSKVEMAVVMERERAETYTPLLSSSFSPGTGFVTANINTSGVYVACLSAKTFSDVSTDYWAYEVVSNLSARNVIDGYPSGKFLPENTITRAEYIKLLVESLGLYDSGASCGFDDVSKNDWYYPYVASAVKANIIRDNDNFYPGTGITRQDMALYSYLAAYAAGIKLPETTSAISFSDESSISTSSLSAVKAMQRAGIINGYTDNTFRPLGTTKRSEASKIIKMLVELLYQS